ncbi:MAG: Ldh family oxidoreductase [Christensenellales bacterium]|jgi:L-2-hydroxycarboxylate dehydrogenase (NAD+)
MLKKENDMLTYMRIPYETAQRFCQNVFGSYGFTPDESAKITDILLAADLGGIESHGIQRLVRYDTEIRAGFVDVHARPETVFETPVSAVIDAKSAMGQLISYEAMEVAIRKAQKSCIGMVAVRNSNHYGIAGYYAQMASKQDLVGICMTNTEAIMVPTFARQAMLGTNPIAFAMPADPIDYLFDAATTVIPRGKLEVYKKRGKPVPTGWVLDENGLDSTDAARVLDNIIAKRGGGILPLGGSGENNSGYKGYGFGMLCEICTAVFAQGATSDLIYKKKGKAEICHFFAAFDYGIFGEKAAIRREFSKYLQKVRDADKAKGRERIYIHGEKEFEARDDRLKNGLLLNEKTLEEMRRIAARQDVDASELHRIS